MHWKCYRFYDQVTVLSFLIIYHQLMFNIKDGGGGENENRLLGDLSLLVARILLLSCHVSIDLILSFSRVNSWKCMTPFSLTGYCAYTNKNFWGLDKHQTYPSLMNKSIWLFYFNTRSNIVLFKILLLLNTVIVQTLISIIKTQKLRRNSVAERIRK